MPEDTFILRYVARQSCFSSSRKTSIVSDKTSDFERLYLNSPPNE